MLNCATYEASVLYTGDTHIQENWQYAFFEGQHQSE